MDLFEKEFLKRTSEMGVINTFASISKLVSLHTIEELGRKLIAAHKPASFNFAGKLGIERPDPRDESRFAPPEPNAVRCEDCAAELEPKVIDYCRKDPAKFGGKILCRKCQKAPAVPAVPSCDGCGVTIDSKVVAFCRFNSKKFGGKKLCRACQGATV
jgi:hypothetical protein